MTDQTASRSGTMGALCDALLGAAKRSRVTIDDVLDAFGQQGHGPLLVVPALIGVTPIGAIPGVPTLLAVVIFLVAAQMLIARESLWLPKLVRRRSIGAERLRGGVRTIRPVARRVDAVLGGRLPFLARTPFPQIAAILCMALSIAVPPLEIVPFAAAAPLGAIAVLGLAILTRDGLLMAIGLAVTAAIPGAVYFLMA